MSTVSTHLSFTQCVTFALGELTAQENALAQDHLAACQGCVEELSMLQRVIGIMRRDKSVAMPSAVVARAVNVFLSAPPPTTFSLRRILARLSFDSAQSAPALAVRTGRRWTRQVLFNAEEFDVDVRMIVADDVWTIKGQVLGPCADGLAELSGPTTTMRTIINTLCQFSFSDLPPGSYKLTLGFVDTDIELPRLQLGE